MTVHHMEQTMESELETEDVWGSVSVAGHKYSLAEPLLNPLHEQLHLGVIITFPSCGKGKAIHK